MSGYQTIEALRPIMHRGPPATPVVDRELFYKPYRKGSPTYQQLKEMKRLRGEGFSLVRIAQKLGFQTGTVHRYVRDVPISGDAAPLRTSGFTDADVRKAARMRRAGFSWGEIGEDIGCGRTTAKRLALGDERDRSREVHTPMNLILSAVTRVMGVPRQDVRSCRQIGGSSPTPHVRARHITFWLAVRHAGMSQRKVGLYLGFDHRTVAHGLAIADKVAAGLTITDRMGVTRVARLFSKAEWPKASV